MENEKYEIVRFVDNDFELDVNVSPKEETIWLTQDQIALLFNVNIPAISKHVNNILDFNELDVSTISILETVRKEGKRIVKRKVKIFNLDMIISIGYRVNSKRGILFRRWANQVLKQYLLNGYSFNEKRCLSCQDNLLDLKERVNQIENKINDEDELYKEKLFYEDQIFDGYSFIKKLLLSAKKEITIIDGYVDITVLDMLNDITIPITIYTFPSALITNQDITKFLIKHSINVIKDSRYHDRFLIIDEDVYSLGSSIKDIGKKRSVMTKLSSISKEMIIERSK